MARKCFVAGNWKMNGSRALAAELTDGIIKALPELADIQVGVAPPSVYLAEVLENAKGSGLLVGAQNAHFEEKGAFTGETAPQMLVDIGADFVILGHSERRHVFGESDELIARKVVAALDVGLGIIICVGEKLDEREAGATEAVVERQLVSALEGVSAEQMSRVVVAYEPVWAIGTGRTATPMQAQEAHAFIRNLVAGKYDGEVADALVIQYGGSVKPENVIEILGQPDVDGALVGGASLKVEPFVAILKGAAAV